MAAYQKQLNELLAQAYNLFRPPPDLSLSQWADKYARLSPESSAEPGKWTSIPYQVGIMDAFTDPDVERITMMKSARVGYTKILNHAIGYHVHLDPCNMLIVQPTLEDADGYSKDELATMIRDTPVIDGIISDPRSRDGRNTIRKKSYPGGVLYLVGANSPRGFRRISARVVLFDEVDGYPASAGTEGDQIKLGIRRSEFFYNRKIVIGSTPTIKGDSRIEDSFEESDKRYYHVPCPHCGEYQVLKWRNLQWPKNKPEKAYFVCEASGCVIEHSSKVYMVERGKWVAEQPFNGHAGFHIWAAYSYSPNATWAKLAQEFLDSKNDSQKLRTFTNTALGESFEEEAEKLDWEPLFERRETYTAPASGAYLLTAGVDVQADRLEVDIQGWAPGEENWQVDYLYIYGDTTMKQPWLDLAAILQRTYKNDRGTDLHISCTCVDSGFNTDYVYAFCKKYQSRRVYATKGRAGSGLPIVDRAVKKKTGNNPAPVRHFNLGVDGAKSIVYSQLRLAEPGPGYRHFSDQLGAEYFEGLTAEKIVTVKRRGFRFREWHLIRPRNEPLDTAVLNMAALKILAPTWSAIVDQTETRPAPPPRSGNKSTGFARQGGLGFTRK